MHGYRRYRRTDAGGADERALCCTCRVCGHYFGEPRQNGTSHKVYRIPWAGDTRVNVQKGRGGSAKQYQVRQVLKAIDKLERNG